MENDKKLSPHKVKEVRKITTSEKATIGDLVVVKGKLTVDKDFGAGYKYHVIIEDAGLTKE